MNTPVIRKVALQTSFQRLTSSRTVGDYWFRAPASGMASLLGDDGVTEVQLERDQEFTMRGVDLSTIKAKSSSIGDHFIIIGATRQL